jgi:hypothetical protein
MSYVYSNTPRSLGVGWRNAKTGPELKENVRGQAFRHDIGELLRGGDVKDAKLAERHSFPHEMDVELDMLGATVVHGVGGEVAGRHIVVVDHGRRADGKEELAEELSEPDARRTLQRRWRRRGTQLQRSSETRWPGAWRTRRRARRRGRRRTQTSSDGCPGSRPSQRQCSHGDPVSMKLADAARAWASPGRSAARA